LVTELEVALISLRTTSYQPAVGRVGESNLALALLPTAVLCAFAAAWPAAWAFWSAAIAFWSTSVILPSFLRVRSCVSSTERPSESTLPFTSPTLVLTNFLLAHAVVPPTTRSVTGTAMKNLRNMIDPPNPNSGEIARLRIHSGLLRSGACCAHAPRADASPTFRSIQRNEILIRSSSTICRAAALRAAGVLATGVTPSG
jgi:hypothetical protein